MTRYRLVNGERIAFTAEEEAARDKEEADAVAYQAANGYKTKRQSAYPSLGDFEMLCIGIVREIPLNYQPITQLVKR